MHHFVSSVGVLLAITACGKVESLGAQEREPTADGAVEIVCRLEPDHITPLTMGRVFRGVEHSCFGCHRDAAQASGAAAGPASPLADGWIENDEVLTWLSEDRHSQAYAVLLTERSQQMGRLLGVEEIHRDARCVACHSGFPVQSVECPDGLLPAPLASDPRVTWGVSCEACHGASGDARHGEATLAGWNVAHNPFTGLADWRYLSPEEKESQYGFYDVRSPASRARMCYSCHVGSAAEGRVVTHEMYAAGHPPLGNVEIESFLRQMPAHWRPLAEKPASVRAVFLARTNQTFEPAAAKTARNIAVAAAVSWGMQLRLTAELAAGEVAAPAASASWPELAQFECSACHHELQSDAWRQNREAGTTPGRPLFVLWPTPLLRAALAAVGGEPSIRDFDAHRQKVARAAAARPFGLPPEQLAPVLEAAADWAEAEAQRLETVALDEAAAENLLAGIGRTASEDVLDHDSARQLTWAFGEVLLSLESEGQDVAAIRKPFAAVAELFVLNLRGNRLPAEVLDGPAVVPVQKIDRTNLAAAFEAAARYNPFEFRQRFVRASEAVAQARPQDAPE